MEIGAITKNKTEQIRVNISEYKGYTYLDLRIFFENEAGEWKPTKKGITISKENIEPLINLLNEGKAQL